MGACMLIPRAAWDAVGPLDEGYFMYLEEVDWCRRARASGLGDLVPAARARSCTTRAPRRVSSRAPCIAQLWRSRLRYYQRYHGPFVQPR